MNLVQIKGVHVTSTTSSVSLTGIDTDKPYLVTLNNVTSDTDNVEVKTRVTKSGSPDTTSNYDCAANEIKAHTTFGVIARQNDDYWKLDNKIGTNTGEIFNAVFYLYNFNSSSKDSALTEITSFRNQGGNLYGNTGGAIHTVQSASDGIHFFLSSGNFTQGKFSLYEVI